MKNKDNKPTSFKEKLENFWYYYKLPVIISILVVGIGVFLYFEFSQSVVSDLKVCLTSKEALSEGTINFNEGMPGLIKDINGDNEANITIQRIFLGEDISSDEGQTYYQNLMGQLSSKGSTLFIFDKTNLDRMIKKDAFCPLNELMDLSAYNDRVVYRNDVPVALHLTGSKVLADMEFTSDDLYAMVLFRRPEDANDLKCNAEYDNAVLVLKELMKQVETNTETN
ncbi:MAG: hypothetical protein E7403_06015 [Ruminococcaceae bacterium]|nr:hypothetical protein [Oscillospiraceae bacterium]